MKKQVELAESIARKAHEGQIRTRGQDKGKPYIIHPERLAAKFKNNELLCAAAWLHDVLEDTSITLDDLYKAGIYYYILDIVHILTKTPNEYYVNFIDRICTNSDAVKIKLADIEDNMESLEEGCLKEKYRMAHYILRKT